MQQEAMKKTALELDANKPFNEQDLKFRSFGIFLDHAKVGIIKNQII